MIIADARVAGKKSSFNGNQTHDLLITSVMLQLPLSYEATWELVVFVVQIVPHQINVWNGIINVKITFLWTTEYGMFGEWLSQLSNDFLLTKSAFEQLQLLLLMPNGITCSLVVQGAPCGFSYKAFEDGKLAGYERTDLQLCQMKHYNLTYGHYVKFNNKKEKRTGFPKIWRSPVQLCALSEFSTLIILQYWSKVCGTPWKFAVFVSAPCSITKSACLKCSLPYGHTTLLQGRHFEHAQIQHCVGGGKNGEGQVHHGFWPGLELCMVLIEFECFFGER